MPGGLILVCGIASEPPISMLLAELHRLRAPFLLFNQRHFASVDCSLQLAAGRVTGTLSIDGAVLALEDVSAVYTRLTDYRELPEFRRLGSGDPERARCARLHEAITEWHELSPGRVVNRLASMGSNGAKPYQTQLIRRFFKVPETLVTNIPGEVLAFRQRHGKVVYKSASGQRSIVSELGEEDVERLHTLASCPVQFQRYIPGWDIRVHCIGQEAIATLIESEATDYRYAHQQHRDEPRLEPFDLPSEVATACVALTGVLGLEFSGIDLRLDPDGAFYCLEVNPSPAYSYCEAQTGQPIAATLARYLAHLA